MLRHGLKVGAGVLVAKGVLDAGSAETAVGAMVSLATVGWYVVEKRRAAAS